MFFSQLPDRVSIYEVSPRDGLQNERATVPLRDKVRLIEALAEAGVQRIEITSFVSPNWIPQLADADELAETIHEHHLHPGVTYSALCPNARGLVRARAAKIGEIAVFVSASETHNRKNVNKTVDQTLAAFEETVIPAREAGLRVRGYVSTVWGCPYEGAVDPKRALAIAKRLVNMGCYQVSLSDTIGVGTPRQTQSILEQALAELPRESIAMHMHDTRGTALATCSSASRWGSGTSTRRLAAWVGVRMPQERPETSRPRTSSTCSTGWGSGPASTSTSSWRRGRPLRASSAGSSPAKSTRRGCGACGPEGARARSRERVFVSNVKGGGAKIPVFPALAPGTRFA
jgi:hydroxymethylglutaryl-CoA lyase